MDIIESTASYEKWISKKLRIIEKDLELKHKHMAGDVFSFFRATYYRWAQVWPVVCKPLTKAPKVLGVGDLHVENFGTWRDAEGRLIWGINDFDEATELPYTEDLVRLATSAHLAISTAKLAISRGDVCDAIPKGYSEGLKQGRLRLRARGEQPGAAQTRRGTAEGSRTLLEEAVGAAGPGEGRFPARLARPCSRRCPIADFDGRIVHRIAGLGSLGRERFVTLAEWRGALVAGKPRRWLLPRRCGPRLLTATSRILYQKVLDASVRCQDPFVGLRMTGLSAGSLPTVRGSNCRTCRRATTNAISRTAWGSRRPMCTSARRNPKPF